MIRVIHIYLFVFQFIFLGSSFGQEENSWNQVDKKAVKIPSKHTSNVEELCRYISTEFDNPKDQIRAIYTWIGRNIKYDHSGLKDENLSYNHYPNQVLAKKRAVCTGYSTLFVALSNCLEIPAEVISGYSKNSITSEVNMSYPDHAWNSVYIDSSWHLIDVTWDAVLWKHSAPINRKEKYFMTNPEVFTEDHLPALPCWQLSTKPMSPAEFVSGIRNSLDTLATTAQNHYTDEIGYLLQLSKAKRRLYEYRQTYQFNPSKENQVSLAHGMLDYAGILTDSIDILIEQIPQKENEAKVEALLFEILDLCDQSSSIVDLHDWQIRMYVDALHAIVIKKYNILITDDESSVSDFEGLLNYLNRAQQLLNDLPDDFQSKGMKQEGKVLLDAVNKKMN